MALRENKKNLEYYEKIKEDVINKEKIKIEDAKDLVANIKQIKIEFKKEADEKDQLYGTISKKEIINFLNEKEIKILSDDIKITQPIRSIGKHEIEINPYQDIYETISIYVNKN